MLSFLPSVIAAAGINLRHFSTYVPSDINQCVVALAGVHQAISSSPTLAAIREKYGHPRFQEVSRIPPIAVSPYMFA